eukprot:jgi/Mesvir1/2873/Mv26583-RA.1
MKSSKSVTLRELQLHFHLPINEVASRLGLCVTVLKQRCRENGIDRWPYRKVKKLDKLITELQSTSQEPELVACEGGVTPRGEGSLAAVKDEARRRLENVRETRDFLLSNPNSSAHLKLGKIKFATTARSPVTASRRSSRDTDPPHTHAGNNGGNSSPSDPGVGDSAREGAAADAAPPPPGRASGGCSLLSQLSSGSHAPPKECSVFLTRGGGQTPPSRCVEDTATVRAQAATFGRSEDAHGAPSHHGAEHEPHQRRPTWSSRSPSCGFSGGSTPMEVDAPPPRVDVSLSLSCSSAQPSTTHTSCASSALSGSTRASIGSVPPSTCYDRNGSCSATTACASSGRTADPRPSAFRSLRNTGAGGLVIARPTSPSPLPLPGGSDMYSASSGASSSNRSAPQGGMSPLLRAGSAESETRAGSLWENAGGRDKAGSSGSCSPSSSSPRSDVAVPASADPFSLPGGMGHAPSSFAAPVSGGSPPSLPSWCGAPPAATQQQQQQQQQQLHQHFQQLLQQQFAQLPGVPNGLANMQKWVAALLLWQQAMQLNSMAGSNLMSMVAASANKQPPPAPESPEGGSMVSGQVPAFPPALAGAFFPHNVSGPPSSSAAAAASWWPAGESAQQLLTRALAAFANANGPIIASPPVFSSQGN